MPGPGDRLQPGRLRPGRRRALSPSRRSPDGGGRRFLVAAFGDPGHAFPAIALSLALQARGHEVVVETWEQWREVVEGAGLAFTGAEAYQVFPPPASGEPGGGEAALALMPLLEDFRPDVVVNDILTVAPALAAERHGAGWATLIPHIYPVQEPGLPFFAVGARIPRTGLGRRAWRAAMPLLEAGLRQGRDDMNAQREAAGLPPTDRFHGGISPELALVATFPELEYPRRWPGSVHVTGPMPFEIPHPDIELPESEDPLVLVAPSTAHDPGSRLVRNALEALADEPVRVVATTNRVGEAAAIVPPDNAVLVEWVSYSQLMPAASLVICHGGHGTVARALAAGTPVLVCPAIGDMSETAARVAWAGAGLSVPWSLSRPAPLNWASRRILAEPSFAARARAIAHANEKEDGATRGAVLLEGLARERAAPIS